MSWTTDRAAWITTTWGTTLSPMLVEEQANGEGSESNRFFGTLVLCVKHSALDAAFRTAITKANYKVWPMNTAGIEGDAYLQKYRITRYPGRPGYWRVLLQFYKPRRIADRLSEGQANLLIKVGSHWQKCVREIVGDELVVEGPVVTNPTTKRTQEWRVVEGENVTAFPQANVILRTAYASPNVPSFMKLVGHWNGTVLSEIGSAGIGTMLMLGADIATSVNEQGVVPVDFHMVYNPDGWNVAVVVDVFDVTMVEYPVTDTAGDAITGRNRTALRYVPAGTEATRDCTRGTDTGTPPGLSFTFATLNGLAFI